MLIAELEIAAFECTLISLTSFPELSKLWKSQVGLISTWGSFYSYISKWYQILSIVKFIFSIISRRIFKYYLPLVFFQAKGG